MSKPILIFDPNTKRLYSLDELEGPYPNGSGMQYNLPKAEEKDEAKKETKKIKKA